MRELFLWLQNSVIQTRWRWLPGSLALAVVMGCLKLGAFQSSEYLAFNTLVHRRPPQSWHDDIVVIEIDEQTLDAVGEFPISRRYYAQVLDFLMRSQSSVVVLDVVFSEPSPDDARLAQAMLHHGQVVLAQAWSKRGIPTLPVPELLENAIHAGHVLNYPDRDGVTRSVPSHIQQVPALGLAAVQAYSLTTDLVPLPEETPFFWINWPGPIDQLPRYSFLDVLQRNVESDRFAEKIVIIGSGVAGVDPIASPFNQDPPTTGIYLQAAVISNLLSENSLRVMSPNYQIAIFLVGLLLGLYLSFCGVLKRWLIGSSLIGIWFGLGLFLLTINIWVPLVWPITLISLSVIFTEVGIRLKANTELQKEVERLWQTYRQDVLVQEGQWPTPFDHMSTPLNVANDEVNYPYISTQSLTPSPPWATPSSFPAWAAEHSWAETIASPDNTADRTGTARWKWLEPLSVLRTQQLTTLVEVFGRSQALHGAIARSLSIGLVAADWQGRIWFCNPSATHFLGVTNGQLLSEALIPGWLNHSTWERYVRNLHDGHVMRWENYHGNQWFELRLEPLAQTTDIQSRSFNSFLPQPYPVRPTPSNPGPLFYPDPLSQSAGPPSSEKSLSSKQNGVGLLLLIEDITTYKQVEEEMRKALAQEKEFNELKSRFVSMVSHELRTPLTIIQTSIEMLERRQRGAAQNKRTEQEINTIPVHDPTLPALRKSSVRSHSKPQSMASHKPRKYFNRIENAVSTMTQLLEDVLLLGKVEAKKLEFNPQYVDCVRLYHDIIEDMQVQPLGYSRIVFNVQGEARPYYVDVDLLKIVLSNLLSNATKYSADNTFIYVDLDCLPDGMILQVEDRGIGIPPETQEQLFKEFHRAANVGNIPGTGLGLSIVKQCVDLHGGDIMVESAVGVGTTFIIQLPSEPPPSEQIPSDSLSGPP